MLSGIVPKMAIRFASFEKYKGWLADKETGKTSVGNIFICTCSTFFFGELGRKLTGNNVMLCPHRAHVNCGLYDACRVRCADLAPHDMHISLPGGLMQRRRVLR